MKITFVAFALLPASFGFAPASPSSKTIVRTASSLQMSFVERLTSKRSGTEDAEIDKVVDRLMNSVTDEDLKAFDGELLGPEGGDSLRSGTGFKHVPSKEQTGVEPHITRLAATMSQQCYELLLDKKRNSFDLSTKDYKVDIILQERQGLMEATNPTFGAAVCGDTMFLGWRGTSAGETPIDVVMDFSMSPIASLVWRKHAKSVRMHSGYSGLAASDIALHMDTIIAECKKRGIKEIVATGQSLGGAIATSAHIIMRALIEDEQSPWHELNGVVNVRSVVFSAPMTLLLSDLESASEETKEFVDAVDKNSCNIILSNDIISRGFGYLSFIGDCIDDAIPDLAPYILKKKRFKSTALKFFFQHVLNLQKQKGNIIGSAQFKLLVKTMSRYTHPGNIVFYEDEETEPVVLKDMGAYNKNPQKDTFRAKKYTKCKSSVNAIEEFEGWHMGTIRPGLSYPELINLD